MSDGRERLCRELADTEAIRLSSALRKKMLAEGATSDEADNAAKSEYLRVYEETFEQAMLGGS